MSDCTSTFDTIQKVYDNYGGYVKTAVGIAVAAVLENPAAAAAAIKAAGKVEEALKNGVSFWNSKIADNGPATIGPRRLDPGAKATGTIVGPGDRKFITLPMHFNSGHVVIKETDGKGQTDIRVCLVDAHQHHQTLVAITVNENSTEKGNEHQVVDHRFSGGMGKVLAVVFDGKSVANSFQYELLLTEA